MTANNWTAADLPDLFGRTVVVTGASSGLGMATTRELARAGARVVLAVRNVAKGGEVARTVEGRTEVRHLELTSLASIREFADAWTGDLDILVNNAGIMLVPEGRTDDGFELQIGTNHLGHFALTNLLLPHITGRVVTISSRSTRVDASMSTTSTGSADRTTPIAHTRIPSRPTCCSRSSCSAGSPPRAAECEQCRRTPELPAQISAPTSPAFAARSPLSVA